MLSLPGKLWSVALLLFLGAICAKATAGSGKDILVYFPNFNPADRADTFSALKARGDHFNQLAMDTYLVDPQGNVSGPTFSDELAYAQSKKMVTYLTVANLTKGNFDSRLVHAIITSPTATQNFIKQVAGLIAANHFTGLNIDFEAVRRPDREIFTAFIEQVAGEMKKHSYPLVVSVPAEQMNDPRNSWSGAFDYKALGAAVDVLQLMTYDENGPWTEPGPVAGLDWVEKSVKYAMTVVPPSKLSLGICAFGFDWDLTQKSGTRDIAWNKIPDLLAKTKAEVVWDTASSSPHFDYTANGHSHTVWYENAQSLGLKAQLVTTYNLGGISVWALGMEDDAFWQAVTPAK